MVIIMIDHVGKRTCHKPPMTGNGKFIPPIKMVIFLGDGLQVALVYQHCDSIDKIHMTWGPLRALPCPRICCGKRGSGTMRKDSVGVRSFMDGDPIGDM